MRRSSASRPCNQHPPSRTYGGTEPRRRVSGQSDQRRTGGPNTRPQRGALRRLIQCHIEVERLDRSRVSIHVVAATRSPATRGPLRPPVDAISVQRSRARGLCVGQLAVAAADGRRRVNDTPISHAVELGADPESSCRRSLRRRGATDRLAIAAHRHHPTGFGRADEPIDHGRQQAGAPPRQRGRVVPTPRSA